MLQRLEKRRRTRAPRVVAKVFAIVLAAVVVVVAAALVSLNLAPVRRFAVSKLNGVLAGQFRGRIVVERIGSISPLGVGGARFRILDPEGRQVLLADGVGARIRTAHLLRSLVSNGPLDIGLFAARADYVDFSVDADEHGTLGIERAVASRMPPKPSEPTTKHSAGVRFVVDGGRIRHAWVHGQPSTSFFVDAEADRAVATVSVLPDRLEISGVETSLSTRQMPLGADLHGVVHAHVILPSGDGKKPTVQGNFDGEVADAHTTASARMDFAAVTAELTSQAKANPSRLFAPGAFAVHVVAKGPLEGVRVNAHADVGRGSVDVDGVSSLAALQFDASVRARHVDLRDAIVGGPESNIGADAKGTLHSVNGEPEGHFELTTEPGRVGTFEVPIISANGVLRGESIDARVVARGEGLQGRIQLRMRPSARGALVDAKATADALDLARATGSLVEGQATVTVDATYGLRDERLTAGVTATATRVGRRGFLVGRATLDAAIDGPASAPTVAAAVHAADIEAGDSVFRSGRVRVRGTLPRFGVSAFFEGQTNAPTTRATADVSFADGSVAISDLRARFDRAGVEVSVGARSARIGGNGVSVDGAAIRGLGRPVDADVFWAKNAVRLHVAAPAVDLRGVASVVGLDPRRFSGSIAAKIDFVARRGVAQGTASVELENAVFATEDRVAGTANLGVHGRSVDGVVDGTWNGGELHLRTEGLRLGGEPAEPRSWAHATGKLNAKAQIDLARVQAVLPDSVLPLAEMSGRADVALDVSREDPNVIPVAALSVHTSHLLWAPRGAARDPSDGTKVESAPSWRVAGIDVDATAELDEGKNLADFRATLHDGHGTLVDASVTAPFPRAVVIEHSEDVISFIENHAVNVKVSVPKRSFADFPPPFGRPEMAGNVEASFDATGPLAAPKIDGQLDVEGVELQRHVGAPPFDARILVQYSENRAKADVSVSSGGKTTLALTAEGKGRLDALVARRPEDWTLATHATLKAFPLEVLPVFAGQRVRGEITGNAEATLGAQEAPHLQAKFDASSVSVGRCRDNSAAFEVNTDGKMVSADARIRQPDGFAVAKGSMGVMWFSTATPPPHAEPTPPVRVEFHSRHFRAAAVAPFVRDILSGLDGRVDGDVKLQISDRPRTTTLEGKLQITDGAFEVAAFGEELQAIRAKILLSPGGVVRVDDLYAEAGAGGKVSGNATAKLDGFDLKSADATFKVPANAPLPVAIQGQVLAEAWGTYKAKATRKDDGALDLDVDVSNSGVRLPDASTRSLEALEPAARVRIGTFRAPGKFEEFESGRSAAEKPSNGPPSRIAVHIRDAEVRRGTDLRVRLDGDPVLIAGKDDRLSGKINLRSGFLEVQGKRFEIESGTITFTKEMDNPEVVVTAGWTAPEGTHVYADFVGPLKTGKVTLRSDPPHSKSEILSLILFGTTTGSTAPSAPGQTAADSGAASAAGIGGGFAAQGLNKALDDLTGLDITARVDTSDSTNPRPELEMRVARDISVALAHVIGVPAPGSNPDHNFATVDWNFSRNWSLDTTFGDAGSSLLDLIWRYRY